MRILHTSDWHLGVSADQAPREEEQRRFLDWLCDYLKEEEIDVLLHAGDVFHHMQPSARSQKLYYEFLARCVGLPTLQQVIITGGNHDSASRLDAPREVLDALKIRVIGGIDGDESSWDRCLCPIYGENGEVELVIVAVPYVHESRLGVRTTEKNAYEIREDMVQAFRFLYTYLGDQAEERYGQVPLITTGHLTCYPVATMEADVGYHVPIHQVESLGSLPPDIFDERYCYVALGHIHKMFQVGSSPAWYSGSPIPTDIVEAQTPCYVILVELNEDQMTSVTTVELPRWRPIFELAGPPEQVLEEIKALHWEEPLPPYLYIDFHVDAPQYDSMNRIMEVLQTFDKDNRPRVVRMKETLIAAEEAHPQLESFERKPLNELKPQDVFEQMYILKHGQPPTPEILSAFSSLLLERED